MELTNLENCRCINCTCSLFLMHYSIGCNHNDVPYFHHCYDCQSTDFHNLRYCAECLEDHKQYNHKEGKFRSPLVSKVGELPSSDRFPTALIAQLIGQEFSHKNGEDWERKKIQENMECVFSFEKDFSENKVNDVD
jgi:hypothetical protein